MAGRIIEACGGPVDGLTVAVLGLTFKPNTDDMRDSASLSIIPALQKAGCRIKAYDPEGMEEAARLLNDVERSEEHTSELQSLMRISYAVFCLKKKNNTHKNTPEK